MYTCIHLNRVFAVLLAVTIGFPAFAATDRAPNADPDGKSPSAAAPYSRSPVIAGVEWAPAGKMPKDRISERNAYEFFVKRDAQNRPIWTRQIEKRGAVFEHAGRCYRSGISYNAGLGRYIWSQIIPSGYTKFTGGKGDVRFEGGFGVYDAPEPWGPWTTVFHTEKWDVGPGETSSFPSKWMSADGRTAHLVFSGDDHFSVRQATFILPDTARPTTGRGPQPKETLQELTTDKH